MQDRTRADSFQMTQEFLARRLGVREASISRVAARLQKQEIIDYDYRGRLTVPDRHRLEKMACSCYLAVKAEFDGLTEALGGL